MEISIKTKQKEDLIDITDQVQDIISKTNTKEGLCILYCPHTTAALTINENADPDVKADILTYLRKIVPENLDYRHTEGNSTAHIKSSLLGPTLSLIIKESKLVLGTWQGVYFFEGDGPRSRKVVVEIR